MFDSFLNKGTGPKGRLGIGTIISVVVHVGLLATAIFLTTQVG